MIQLQTEDGQFIAEFEAPHHAKQPHVVCWGARVFVLISIQQRLGLQERPLPIYRETLAMVVADRQQIRQEESRA